LFALIFSTPVPEVPSFGRDCALPLNGSSATMLKDEKADSLPCGDLRQTIMTTKTLEKLGPRVLSGAHVALEPLAPEHREALKKAASDPALWRFLPMNGAADFAAVWDAAMAEIQSGSRIAFAVRRFSDDAIVGSTSYLADVPQHGRVEIGWTWYTREAQGGVINAECKFLLMRNAFETCGYNRVEMKTDSTNLRSRAAIKKLGAQQEGTLRGHMWNAGRGYWRDTVYYSVLADEWPAIKAKLERRIARQET
jgi:RimJ/RimL family protein N-acetyltransferase